MNPKAKITLPEARFDLPDKEGINILREDLIAYEHELESAFDNQRLRRAYVRSAIALVEATTRFLKEMSYNFTTQIARPIQQHLGMNLAKCPVKLINQRVSDGELLLLKDEQVTIKGSGEIDTTVAFSDLKKSIKFALKTTSRVFNVGVPLDFATDSDWHALTVAVDVRNRISHPKPNEPMNVADDEINSVRRGYSWIIHKEIELTLRIFDSVVASLKQLQEWVTEFKPEYIQQLQAEIDAFAFGELETINAYQAKE